MAIVCVVGDSREAGNVRCGLVVAKTRENSTNCFIVRANRTGIMSQTCSPDVQIVQGRGAGIVYKRTWRMMCVIEV